MTNLEEIFYKLYRPLMLNRPGAAELYKWLHCSDFFEAPASTKYHGAYKGGLAEHSIEVYKYLNMLNKELCIVNGKMSKYSDETIAVCGLLHDVCKIGVYVGDQAPYTYCDKLAIGHGEKSVIQIMKYIQLTDEEIIAITWHMGAFDYRVKGGSRDINTAYDNSPLAVMLHTADMFSTYFPKPSSETGML